MEVKIDQVFWFVHPGESHFILSKWMDCLADFPLGVCSEFNFYFVSQSFLQSEARVSIVAEILDLKKTLNAPSI